MKPSDIEYSRPIQPARARIINAKRAIAIVILALALSLQAGPVTVEELSLLVRMRESDASILNQISQRRLVRAPDAQQEAALKKQGASEALLKAARDPKLRLSDADGIAYEKWRAYQKTVPQLNIPTVLESQVDVVAARRTTLPSIAPLESIPSIELPVISDDAGAASGIDLIIEKLTIQNPPPVPAPYYLWLQVRTGRAEMTFNIPNKTYGNEVDTSDIVIPLNIRIKNVRLRDWATVRLQFDNQDAAVRSIAPLKKASARIEISEDPLERNFGGHGDESENFVYVLKWHAERK